MKTSKHQLWRKSMLHGLDLDSIFDWMYEIIDNGDAYGFDHEDENESGYYQEYKPMFDDLAAGAYNLREALQQWVNDGRVSDHWDDMTVALLGHKRKVLGFDAVEEDYYGMLAFEEDLAVEEATKRIERLTKRDMIRCYRTVMAVLVMFFDLKAAHDCLTSIVDELDERSMLLAKTYTAINSVYYDLTGKNAAEFDQKFDQIIATLPQRMWVE